MISSAAFALRAMSSASRRVSARGTAIKSAARAAWGSRWSGSLPGAGGNVTRSVLSSMVWEIGVLLMTASWIGGCDVGLTGA